KAGVELTPGALALDDFFGLGGTFRTDEATINWAVAVYALYRVHNGQRRHLLATSEILGAFGEYLREGRSGHGTDA
ncbi:unnamed protein product, partial [Prorocentrum cordatum]